MPTAGCIMVSVNPTIEQTQWGPRLGWKNADNVKKLIASLLQDNAHPHLVIIIANLPHNYESWYPTEGYSELSPFFAQRQADQLGQVIQQDLISFIDMASPEASYSIILWKDLNVQPDYIKMVTGDTSLNPTVVQSSKPTFENAKNSIRKGVDQQVDARIATLNTDKKTVTGTELTEQQKQKLKTQSMKIVTEELAQLFQMLDRGLPINNQTYRIETTWYMDVLQKGSPLHVPFNRDTFPIICKVDPLSNTTFKQSYTNSMKRVSSIRADQQALAEKQEIRDSLRALNIAIFDIILAAPDLTRSSERQRYISTMQNAIALFNDYAASQKIPILITPYYPNTLAHGSPMLDTEPHSASQNPSNQSGAILKK